MAEDKVEGREATWQQLFPWTHLFRGFQIALGLDKFKIGPYTHLHAQVCQAQFFSR